MTTSPTTTFTNQLDADWKCVATRNGGRRCLRTWKSDTEHGEVFARFVSLDEIIATLHAATPAESDPILAALIGFAQSGDQVASRLVLQSFAGLAIQVSARCRPGGRGFDNDHVADVFGVLAEQIAIFPLNTHPTAVAQHLSFMLRRRMNRRHRRASLDTVSLDWTGSEDSHDDTDSDWADKSFAVSSTDSITAADRVASVVRNARARGGLDDDQARLLMFVAAGHQVAALARQAGCHRSRMGVRVAKAAAAAADFAVAA
jgi:hypothetical protein